MATTEEQRIQVEYQRRSQDPIYHNLYTALNPAAMQCAQSLESAIMRLLRREHITDLSNQKFLEVGCGSGGQILRWLGYGVRPENAAGIDLLPDRIRQARHRLPAALDLRQGDASCLPFEDRSFDIVNQYTMFSSILDDQVRQAAANEMLRVLRPDGLIIWYDFWLNPINHQTRGVRRGEIRRLFASCRFRFYKITLVPPLSRRLALISLTLCSFLEKLKILNTHYLVGINPGKRPSGASP